ANDSRSILPVQQAERIAQRRIRRQTRLEAAHIASAALMAPDPGVVRPHSAPEAPWRLGNVRVVWPTIPEASNVSGNEMRSGRIDVAERDLQAIVVERRRWHITDRSGIRHASRRTFVPRLSR